MANTPVWLLVSCGLSSILPFTSLPLQGSSRHVELGYFMGRLGRDKVLALKPAEVEIPSDFAGVVWVPIDTSHA